MPKTPIETKISCTQCGGELHPDEGQVFLICPFCNSAVYLDKSQVVFHWSLAPTLTETQAAASLARWMSGSETVKDLDKKARITGVTFQFFPLWYFRWKAQHGEETGLEPAAATSVTELRRLKLPAGDLQKYDPALDPKSVEPTVPLEAALAWIGRERPVAERREAALVHVPLYIFKYAFQNQTYTAVVEGATGVVLANLFPAKPEAPYLLAGGATAGVYLVLAMMALGGAALSGIAVVLALVAAPILFAFAAWVANKV